MFDFLSLLKIQVLLSPLSLSVMEMYVFPFLFFFILFSARSVSHDLGWGWGSGRCQSITDYQWLSSAHTTLTLRLIYDNG